MQLDTTCLYSTVKNVSGGRRTFGFLPPHGRSLAADEEFTTFGDVRQAMYGNRGSERSVARRDIMAFEDAIERGDLVIINTPSPVLVDQTSGESRMLQVSDDVLSAIDPCWFDSVDA